MRSKREYLIRNLANYTVKDLEALIELNYEPREAGLEEFSVFVFVTASKELLSRINEGCPEATAKVLLFDDEVDIIT